VYERKQNNELQYKRKDCTNEYLSKKDIIKIDSIK